MWLVNGWYFFLLILSLFLCAREHQLKAKDAINGFINITSQSVLKQTLTLIHMAVMGMEMNIWLFTDHWMLITLDTFREFIHRWWKNVIVSSQSKRSVIWPCLMVKQQDYWIHYTHSLSIQLCEWNASKTASPPFLRNKREREREETKNVCRCPPTTSTMSPILKSVIGESFSSEFYCISIRITIHRVSIECMRRHVGC